MDILKLKEKNAERCVKVLVGPQASGKSTYLRGLIHGRPNIVFNYESYTSSSVVKEILERHKSQRTPDHVLAFENFPMDRLDELIHLQCDIKSIIVAVVQSSSVPVHLLTNQCLEFFFVTRGVPTRILPLNNVAP